MPGQIRASVLAGVVCVMVCLLAPAERAEAQQFRFDPLSEPQVTTEEIRSYERMLGLSGDQVMFAEVLLEAYMGGYQELRQEFRQIQQAAREEFRDTRDRQVWEDLQQVTQVFAERREQLDNQFLNDFRLVLTPEQAQEWGRVERFRRRFYTLSQGGLISGETVDLTRIVSDLSLNDEQREEIAPILDRYEMALDRALVARNEIYEQGMREGMRMWQNMQFAEMERRFTEAREAATRLRDVNRQFARQIESSLGQDMGRRFSREFQQRSFPDIYRDTVGMRALDQALTMDDLNDEQAERILQLQSGFMRQVDQANARLQEATEESEQNRSVRQMFGMGRGGGDAPVREARQAREQLDQTVMDRLRSVLTEEQFARLPGQERRDWRRVLEEEGGGPRAERARGGAEGERPEPRRRGAGGGGPRGDR